MYKVTITQTKQIVTLTRAEWVQGGTIEHNPKTGYGYTPQVPQKATVTETILDMTAETLNVPSVVAAIMATYEPKT